MGQVLLKNVHWHTYFKGLQLALFLFNMFIGKFKWAVPAGEIKTTHELIYKLNFPSIVMHVYIPIQY